MVWLVNEHVRYEASSRFLYAPVSNEVPGYVIPCYWKSIVHALYVSEFPMEIGKTWRGEIVKSLCMAGMVPRNGYFTVEGIKQHETLKSFARVGFTII